MIYVYRRQCVAGYLPLCVGGWGLLWGSVVDIVFNVLPGAARAMSIALLPGWCGWDDVCQCMIAY